jgi:hypothetical protein
VTVRSVTVDGLVAGGALDPARVGLLWIDAPFHEAKVLAGASTLLDAGVPVVTAIRPGRESWPEARRALLELLAGYAGFADLRGEARFCTDLGSLLDARRHSDLIAVRRTQT